jgi:hypothetical protein
MDDVEIHYRTYLQAYVEATGGGRLDGLMALREITDTERAAIALAVHHVKLQQAPASRIQIAKELREMLRAPAVPSAPAVPPTPTG